MKTELIIAAALSALFVGLAPSAAQAQSADADAKARFDQGVAHYQRAIELRNEVKEEAALDEFRAAAKDFEAAHAVNAERGTLYAWAQAERQADNCERAVELYQKLLDSKPDAREQVDAATQSLAICDDILAKKRAAAANNDTSLFTNESDENSATPSWTGRLFGSPLRLALLGVGIAGLGASAGFFVASNSDKDYAASRSDRWSEGIDRANSKRLISGISLAAGVGLIAASVILDEGSSIERTASTGVGLHFDGRQAGLVFVGEF